MYIDYETLNASLRDLVDNIHSYYVHSSSNNHISSDRLKDIYKTIFDYPLLKDKILWFNAWFEKDDGSLSLHFLFEKHTDIATKGILEKVFSHREFDSYVTSVRDLNFKLKRKDLSYIISNCDDTELSTLEGLSSDIFFHLKFKEITESIFNSTNFGTLHNELDQKYRVSTTTGVDETIKRIREMYHKITKHHKNEIEHLKQQLKTYSIEHVENKDVAKIINHFFWIKLAYPVNCKMIIALPGVMAKAVRSVPMGVNVGLKEIIPSDVIYFLKTAILLFFTRESVDFFEGKVQKERDLRMAIFREVYHDIGRIIMPSIIKATRQSQKNSAIWLLEYLRDRLELLRSLSIEEKKNKGVSWPIRERINDIYNKLSLERKNKLKLSSELLT